MTILKGDSLAFLDGIGVNIAISGYSRSLAYADRTLKLLGVDTTRGFDEGSGVDVLLRSPGSEEEQAASMPTVRLWDFERDSLAGAGIHASAKSGVSWVIGFPGEPPGILPLDIPEKWCGLFGVSLALSLVTGLGGGVATRRDSVWDVAAVDVLHSFARQNYGNHTQIPDGWRREGRTAPEHGGIFPQGFFPCSDGYVTVVARSQNDWERVLAALDEPEWAKGNMRDPFSLAQDSSVVDPLFMAELKSRSRMELLDRAVSTGATIAPVFTVEESKASGWVPITAASGLPFNLGSTLGSPAQDGAR